MNLLVRDVHGRCRLKTELNELRNEMISILIWLHHEFKRERRNEEIKVIKEGRDEPRARNRLALFLRTVPSVKASCATYVNNKILMKYIVDLKRRTINSYPSPPLA
ncbi:uncharacterized protein LOC108622535 [Ceratina calcarata]|uniref:Uncharacterized protein LOC108622535 n=1 Tax=Ceratina calcarata TaxID=156304 RepID=A0AAJ7N3K2_9HYME|nr:uncharacterized protein LOC108622535 [Ceratina calcarata]